MKKPPPEPTCGNEDSDWTYSYPHDMPLNCQLPKGHDGDHEATVWWETASQWCHECDYVHVPGKPCLEEPA